MTHMATSALVLSVFLLAACHASPHNQTWVDDANQHVLAIRCKTDVERMSRYVKAAGGTVVEQFDHNQALVVAVPHSRLPQLSKALREGADIRDVKRLNITLPVGMPIKPSVSSSTAQVALCVMVRNQHDDIVEWIEHYLRLGVGLIHLYDHGSNPPLLHTVSHFIRVGVVLYTWLPDALANAVSTSFVVHFETGRHNFQWFVYSECLSPRIKQRHEWMAFFDVDEFLILRNTSVQDLPTFLSAYSAYAGLAVNWMSFGSSGHLVKQGSTLASYWRCCTRKHVKTIVNTKYVLHPQLNPHNFIYRRGKFCVNENFERVDEAITKGWTGSKVVLNHYVIKSRDEFLVKMQRGGGAGGRKGYAFMQTIDRLSTSNCTDAMALMQHRQWP